MKFCRDALIAGLLFSAVFLAGLRHAPWSSYDPPVMRASYIPSTGIPETTKAFVGIFADRRLIHRFDSEQARDYADNLSSEQRAFQWQIYNAADEYDASPTGRSDGDNSLEP